jgi:hypothetical protein
MLRNATDAPKCEKSSTESENTDPNREMPRSDIDELRRPKLLSDSADPTSVKSRMDTADPIRENPRSDKEAPRWTKSITDSENTEPKRAKPSNETDDPIRAN